MMRKLYTALLLLAVGFFIITLMDIDEPEAEDVTGSGGSEDPGPVSAADVFKDLQTGRA